MEEQMQGSGKWYNMSMSIIQYLGAFRLYGGVKCINQVHLQFKYHAWQAFPHAQNVCSFAVCSKRVREPPSKTLS